MCRLSKWVVERRERDEESRRQRDQVKELKGERRRKWQDTKGKS